MKISNIILIILATILLAIYTVAYTTVQITAPTSFETQQSTSVNVSGGINESGFPDIYINKSYIYTNRSMVNVTIMNKSCQSCSYGVYSSYVMNASGINAHNWNKTITLQAGYNWIYLNWTNVSIATQPHHAATSARIINIDPDMYELNVGGLGTINFSLDTGNITSSGNIKIAGCLVFNCSSAGGCVFFGDCV